MNVINSGIYIIQFSLVYVTGNVYNQGICIYPEISGYVYKQGMCICPENLGLGFRVRVRLGLEG